MWELPPANELIHLFKWICLFFLAQRRLAFPSPPPILILFFSSSVSTNSSSPFHSHILIIIDFSVFLLLLCNLLCACNGGRSRNRKSIGDNLHPIASGGTNLLHFETQRLLPSSSQQKNAIHQLVPDSWGTYVAYLVIILWDFLLDLSICICICTDGRKNIYQSFMILHSIGWIRWRKQLWCMLSRKDTIS